MRGAYTALCVLLLCAYAFWLWSWMRRTQPALVSVYYVLFSTWCVASVIYIERGIYIVEQDRFSGPNGAAVGLLVTYALLFVALRATATALPRVPVEPLDSEATRRATRLLLMVGTAALIVLAINLVLSPIPLLDASVDRYDYWRRSRFPLLRGLLGNTSSIVAFIFGVGFSLSPRTAHGTRRWALIGFGAYLVYLAMIGHKFGGPVTALIWWALPGLVIRDGPIRVSRRLLVGAAAGMAFLFGLVYWQYSTAFNPYGNLDVGEAILYRALGLQGHLWWGAWQERIIHHVEPTLRVSQLLDGMQHLMLAYGTPGIDADPERGVTFSAGYPAILLHTFPAWAVYVIQIPIGIAIGAVAWGFYRLLRRGRVFWACVVLQFYAWVEFAVTMGSFAKVVNLGGLLVVLVVGGRALHGYLSRLRSETQLPERAEQPQLG